MRHLFVFLLILRMLSSAVAYCEQSAFPLYLLGYMSSKAGYMPPSGFYFRNDVYHHYGHVKEGLFGGRQVAKANAKISLNVLALNYISPWKLLGADVACGALVPIGKVDVRAELQVGKPKLVNNSSSCDIARPTVKISSRTIKRHQVAHGVGDSLIIPLMLGWHAESYNLHLLAYQGLFLPTGGYKKGSIANMGQNHFATETDAGFTWLNTNTGTEVSAMTGVTVNFTNHKTHYRSGTGWHTEFFAGQYLNKDLQVGLAGYWFYQLTPDKLHGRQFLDGFRGQVLGLAPCLSYEFALGKVPVFANIRYYNETNAKNYLKGGSFFFTLTVPIS
jgi:hypothetical protein